MKKKRFGLMLRVLAALLALLLLSGCAGSVESLLDSGELAFAGGRQEQTGSVSNVDDELQSMIDLYGSGYRPPSVIQVSTDPIPTANPAEPVPTSEPQQGGYPVSIASRQELIDAFTQMVDAGDDSWVSFRLAGGFVPAKEDLQAVCDVIDTTAWMNAGYVKSFGWYGGAGYCRLQVNYVIGGDEIRAKQAAAVAEAENVAAALGLSALSDGEKVLAVNDYLCDTVDYPDDIDDRYDHSPWRPLFEGVGVCDGYARTACLLLKDAGMEVMVVTGFTGGGGGHAWNLVRVDGAWYQLDVCWNDTGSDRTAYLLVDDDTMAWSRSWDTGFYPAASSGRYAFATAP